MGLSWIDEYVYGVIDHCCSRDIFEIYDSLNINIKRVDKADSLLQGNDALYIRSYFGLEVVFIRDDLPYKYEKFTLAHELGRAILHAEVSKAAYNSKLINKSKLEKQSDYFALRLLAIAIDKDIYEGFTLDQISKDLCVTEDSLINIK
ncbi:ImmA/IrrE family metallo-endopeptidase [Tissierella carlieri]|uniref:ImmA/IrrE family metallo-endopeptidase n=2 Tax=Tissierella carlieri TaxID=689904 RepID=A0ABT1SFP6_9FIRM|nr:ImmA/IrrE family metallo-endopeptidase [Tissierella carlieri]